MGAVRNRQNLSVEGRWNLSKYWFKAIAMLSAYSSRIFPKTLHKNPISPSIAFSLLKKFSPSTPLFQVRAMADSSAASSPFKKIQIQRGDSVSICCRVFFFFNLFFVYCFDFWFKMDEQKKMNDGFPIFSRFYLVWNCFEWMVFSL